MANQNSKNSKNVIFKKKMAQNSKMGAFFIQKWQNNGLSITFWVFLSFTLQGQQTSLDLDIQNTLQTIIEDFTEFSESGEEFDFNTLYEELFNLYRHKLDINDSTEDDLNQLFFLTDADIQNILGYRKTYGDFLSIYELQSIPGLTFEKITVLRLFVHTGSVSNIPNKLKLKEFNESNNQLYLKWKYNVETAKGFQSVNGDNPKFIGDKHHLYVRYAHSSTNQRYGLIIEKDPGEHLVNGNSETGIDYLSVHYQKSNPTKWLRQLNLGDYSVNLGQGLIAHSSFGLGKSSLTTTIKRGRSGARIYNSTSENLGFRGIAMELSPQSSVFSGLIFGSYASRDANLGGIDSSGISTFTSLPSSGLHRTEGEREDQDVLYETTAGSTLKFQPNESFQLSMNSIHHKFNKELEVGSQLYQLYRWQGQELSNYSVDYNAQIEGWNIFGEFAYSSNNGWANIHGLIKTLDPAFDISLVYRNYGARYQSLYANAFGERSTVNNEKGIYFGMEYRPSRDWSIRAYLDQWRNDWLQFRVDGPASGKEYLLRIDYREKRKKHLYVQYRYEVKDENSNRELLVDIPVPRIIQRVRFHGAFQLTNGIELRSRLEFSLFDKENKIEKGVLIYQDVIRRKIDSPFSISARMAYFNISDFDARIYSFENDLLLEYYIPSFNGEGVRYYVHGRYNFSKKFMAEIRWDQTKYFDTDFISSGNNEIKGNFVSRLKMQLRYQF